MAPDPTVRIIVPSSTDAPSAEVEMDLRMAGDMFNRVYSLILRGVDRASLEIVLAGLDPSEFTDAILADFVKVCTWIYHDDASIEEYASKHLHMAPAFLKLARCLELKVVYQCEKQVYGLGLPLFAHSYFVIDFDNADAHVEVNQHTLFQVTSTHSEAWHLLVDDTSSDDERTKLLLVFSSVEMVNRFISYIGDALCAAVKLAVATGPDGEEMLDGLLHFIARNAAFIHHDDAVRLEQLLVPVHLERTLAVCRKAGKSLRPYTPYAQLDTDTTTTMVGVISIEYANTAGCMPNVRVKL